MIQEILDFWLIKSQFLSMTEDELIAKIDTEEKLDNYCFGINEILNTDVFFQTSDDLMEKLQYLVYKKRFEGRHSNDTIRNFNYIVDKIQKYKRLTEKDKEYLRKCYIRDEASNRDLPYKNFPGYTLDLIYTCIKYDYIYGKDILNCNPTPNIYNPVHCLGTINLLANCYPSVFKENPDSLSLSYALALTFQNRVVSRGYLVYSKMAKKTQKLLEKVEEEMLIDSTVKYDIKTKLIKMD